MSRRPTARPFRALRCGGDGAGDTCASAGVARARACTAALQTSPGGHVSRLERLPGSTERVGAPRAPLRLGRQRQWRARTLSAARRAAARRVRRAARGRDRAVGSNSKRDYFRGARRPAGASGGPAGAAPS